MAAAHPWYLPLPRHCRKLASPVVRLELAMAAVGTARAVVEVHSCKREQQKEVVCIFAEEMCALPKESENNTPQA